MCIRDRHLPLNAARVPARPRRASSVRIFVYRLTNVTDRDQEIVTTMTRYVRILTRGQIARFWFKESSNPEVAAAKRLRVLEEIGLLVSRVLPCRPELVLTSPACCWSPGDSEPPLRRLARELARRWTSMAVPTALFVATRRAAQLFGGNAGREPRPSEISHDVTLSGIYLRHLETDRDAAGSWISEAGLSKLGYGKRTRLPDAMIERHGRRVAIELVGEYSLEKLVSFHAFCEEEELAYELW